MYTQFDVTDGDAYLIQILDELGIHTIREREYNPALLASPHLSHASNLTLGLLKV